ADRRFRPRHADRADARGDRPVMDPVRGQSAAAQRDRGDADRAVARHLARADADGGADRPLYGNHRGRAGRPVCLYRGGAAGAACGRGAAMRRLVAFPILTTVLFAMWVLLTGFSPGHVLLGAAVALLDSRVMLALGW